MAPVMADQDLNSCAISHFYDAAGSVKGIRYRLLDQNVY